MFTVETGDPPAEAWSSSVKIGWGGVVIVGWVP